jgi:hypothetical protein
MRGGPLSSLRPDRNQRLAEIRVHSNGATAALPLARVICEVESHHKLNGADLGFNPPEAVALATCPPWHLADAILGESAPDGGLGKVRLALHETREVNLGTASHDEFRA